MRALPLALILLVAGCSSGETEEPVETDTDTDTDTDMDTDTDFDPPEWCPGPIPGLVDILDTPAAPYLIAHPEPDPAVTDAPAVIFLPGGPGDQGSANTSFGSWLGKPEGREPFRVVVPYSADNNLTDEWDRVAEIREEVFLCWGGREDAVHLGGTSNGGIGAYSIMLDYPELFTTLLGAPGAWQSWDETAVKAALDGKAVFNGVGENDTGWIDAVQQIHALLLAAGIDSTYVEFAGEGHVLSPDFDEGVFYEFWATH